MKARENPFAAERVDAIRYRPLGTRLEAILTRLAEMDYRAAIVGPEGSGKSTLLETLAAALEHRGLKTRLVFANDTSPLTGPRRRQLLYELAPEEIVLLDGADRVRWSVWLMLKRRLAHGAAGLIITAHRRGLLPTLFECTTTPSLLKEIVGGLRPQGHTVSDDLLDDLYDRHHGNLRDCLRNLYDLHAED